MTGATGTFPEIPLFDLKVEESDLEAVAETLRSGWLTMGPRVEAFEREFAEMVGVEHALAVSTCTAALHLSYLAAGVGPGDEVIVPSFTFAATATAAIYCGATPVFADVIGPEDLSIDPEHVEALITPRTKAVAVVHFAGYAGRLDALTEICERHGLALVEDVAHGPASEYRGRRLGSFGLTGCFSFFSNKVLAASEGGLVTTNDARVAEFVRTRRSHAMSSGTWTRHNATAHAADYDVDGLGYNYRLDEPRAALLSSRIKRLPDEIVRRQALTRRYREKLAGIDGVTFPYTDAEVGDSCCYVMPILVDDPDRRGPMRIAMREKHGVQTSLFYPCVHRFTAYRERFGEISLPRTEDASSREITIPLFATLSETDQDRVIDAIATEVAA